MSAVPQPWRSLTAEIKKLQEQVRRLTNASPFSGTGWEVIDPEQIAQSGAVTIPDNGLLLVDGGDVVMLNESLVEVFRLGIMPNGDRGIIFRRNDGTEAMSIRSLIPGGPQVMRWYDRNGGVLGGGALLSNSGFDAPHIDMRFIPVDYTSGATAQSVSATSFTATHEFRGFKQNPALKMQLMVKCSDGTTSGEIQVWNVINSVYLGGFLGSPATHTITVPTGTTDFTRFEFSSPLAIAGAMSADLHFEIHVKRTAGSGSITVAPVRTIGSGF